VLDNGLNGAYEAADDASKVATNFLDFNSSTGLDVSYSGTNAKARINGSGLEIYNSSDVSVAKFQTSGARLGKTGDTRLEMDYHSMKLIDKDGNTYLWVSDLRGADGTYTFTEYFVGDGSDIFSLSIVADSVISITDSSHSGNTYTWYAEQYLGKKTFIFNTAPSKGATITATYVVSSEVAKAFTMGIRDSGYNVGPMSFAEGYHCVATGFSSHAGGVESKATGGLSFAFGRLCNASGVNSFAIGTQNNVPGSDSFVSGIDCTVDGSNCVAIGQDCETTKQAWNSQAFGWGTLASGISQLVCGEYNVSHPYSNSEWPYLFIVGNGDANNRSDAMYVRASGNVWIAGSLTQNSDRRLKEHVAYLGDDAAGFVRELRPALFVKDGERHTGFYAQDVQEAEPDGWDTSTVTAQHTDESLDFDPLTLDYTALIAPLVAYAQALERRIDQQQQIINGLIGRIEALEGRM